MSLKTFAEAAALVRRQPILWSVGLVMSALAVLTIVVPTYGGSFYAEPLALLQVVLVPFLVGGVYGTIKANSFTLDEFLHSGRTYYFRILLAGLFIFFAAIVTLLLLAIPGALLGLGFTADLVSFLLFGVLIPIAFFTFFYDTVAVFEDEKVLESIRRSIEFVLNNAGQVVIFYLVNVALLLVLGFAGLFAWSVLLAGRLEPITQMNATDVGALTPQEILGLIGAEGIWVTAAVYAAVILVSVPILYAYKATFYKSRMNSPKAEPQGEYDEKGRWYKY